MPLPIEPASISQSAPVIPNFSGSFADVSPSPFQHCNEFEPV